MNNMKETKKCKICGRIIEKDEYGSEYSWKQRKYCYRSNCRKINTYINSLRKEGYKIVKL